MYWFYVVGTYVVMFPLVFLWMLIRSRKQPNYRRRWGERLGFIKPITGKPVMWVHAVSMGEVVAAIPLIEALMKKYPHYQMLVTTITPTGSAKVTQHFGDRVQHIYLAYDFFFAVRRFLSRVKPVVGFIMETEIWPNLYRQCGKRDIPLLLCSARLSARSEKSYQRIPGPQVIRDALRELKAIAAQTELDGKRLLGLGAFESQITVIGNIKFDLDLPADLLQKAQTTRNNLGKNRPVWVAASTHDGEEQYTLNAHQELLKKQPDALLALVPRHPDRFNDVANLLDRNGWQYCRHSEQRPCKSNEQVFLLDAMGELLNCYAAADIAFTGGSFVPVGGHNMLEPAALAKPVLSGTYVHNFEEIATQMTAVNALKLVDSPQQLAVELQRLFTDEDAAKKMGEAGHSIVTENKGALQRLLQVIEKTLPDL